jgi:nitrous oxide reductase
MSRKSEIDGPIGDESRRAFIKDVVLAGGATAMAAAAGGALAAPTAEDDAAAAPKTSETGYRVTPHVRAYYDKARF